MAEKIASFDNLDTGIWPSVPNDKAPMWVDGRNIIFKERSAQPIPGQFSLLNKLFTSPGVGVIEHVISGVPYLYWGHKDRLFRFKGDDFTVSDATLTDKGVPGPAVVQLTYAGIENQSSSARQTRWSFATFGTFVLATNGVDFPQKWKPAGPDFWPDGAADGVPEFDNWKVDATDGSIPDRAEIVRELGPYVILFNTDDGQDISQWSDEDAIDIWLPTATNAAGQLPLRDMNGEILSVEKLGRGLGVYGRDQLLFFEFVGAPFYFGAREILTGIGAVGKDSVTVVGTDHYGFGPRGIWRTNGSAREYIDEPVHDFVYQNLNLDQISKVVSWYDASQGVVFWSYPQANSLFNSISVGYHIATSNRYEEHVWGIYEFARSAATSGSIFDFIVTIDRLGTVYQQGVETAVGSPEGVPLQVPATMTLKLGYGEGQYGKFTYGGKDTGTG